MKIGTLNEFYNFIKSNHNGINSKELIKNLKKYRDISDMEEISEELPPPEAAVPEQDVQQGFDAMDQQQQQPQKPVKKKTNIPGSGETY